MAMWKYRKRYDEKIFENIFFEILSLPYFRKFSHSKISTYTVLHYRLQAPSVRTWFYVNKISIDFRKDNKNCHS